MFASWRVNRLALRSSRFLSLAVFSFFALSAGLAGALVVNEPEIALMIAALPFALIAYRLPLAQVVVFLLVVRTLTDNLSAGGTTIGVSAAVSGLLIVIGIGCMIANYKGLAITVTVVVCLLASNQIAVNTFGSSMYREAIRAVSIVMVFYIAYTVRPRMGDLRAAWSVVIIGVLPALVAIYQWSLGLGILVAGDIRPAGTLAHPNSAGLFFAICGLCAVYLMIERLSWFSVTSALFFLLALLATASITSLLSYLVMIISMTVFHPRVRAGLRFRLIVGIVGGLIAVAYTPVLSRRLAGLFEDKASASSTKSLDWRLDTWADLWGSVSDAPIFGQGLGATATGLVVKGNVPHNEYIRLLVETGFAGAFVVIAVVAWIGAKLVSLSRITGGKSATALVVSILFGLMVSATTANTFLYSIPSFCVALIFGASLSSVGSSTVDGPALADAKYSAGRSGLSGREFDCAGN